jgi:hypothetical protein
VFGYDPQLICKKETNAVPNGIRNATLLTCGNSNLDMIVELFIYGPTQFFMANRAAQHVDQVFFHVNYTCGYTLSKKLEIIVALVL